jgi:hypothetical protein
MFSTRDRARTAPSSARGRRGRYNSVSLARIVSLAPGVEPTIQALRAARRSRAHSLGAFMRMSVPGGDGGAGGSGLDPEGKVGAPSKGRRLFARAMCSSVVCRAPQRAGAAVSLSAAFVPQCPIICVFECSVSRYSCNSTAAIDVTRMVYH